MKHLIFLIFVACLLGGVHELYTWFAHPERKSYTIDEYLDGRPSDRWVIINDGVLDLTRATFPDGDLTAGSVYVPLIKRDAAPDDAVVIVFETKHRGVIEDVARIRQSSHEQENGAVSDRSQSVRRRSVHGLIAGFMRSHSKESVGIQNLAGDFVVLEDSRSPSWGIGVFLLVVALVVIVIASYLPEIRWSGKTNLPPSHEGPPPVPRPVRVSHPPLPPATQPAGTERRERSSAEKDRRREFPG